MIAQFWDSWFGGHLLFRGFRIGFTVTGANKPVCTVLQDYSAVREWQVSPALCIGSHKATALFSRPSSYCAARTNNRSIPLPLSPLPHPLPPFSPPPISSPTPQSGSARGGRWVIASGGCPRGASPAPGPKPARLGMGLWQLHGPRVPRDPSPVPRGCDWGLRRGLSPVPKGPDWGMRVGLTPSSGVWLKPTLWA